MMQAQIINFLEATVIFLLMTNAVSIFAATYAITLARGSARDQSTEVEENSSLLTFRRLRLH
jgi:hypothetical protein